MDQSIFGEDIIPFILWFVWLVILTVVIDYLLHINRIVETERYSGIAGLSLLVLSFAYSLRKRKIISFGKLPLYLRAHEYLAWLGALLIMVHGGIHFNSILAWGAMVTMVIAVLSGLVGQYLLKKTIDTLSKRKNYLSKAGMGEEEIEKKIFWDALMVDNMKKWRYIHKPITIIFFVLTSLHVLTVVSLWSWGKW